MSARIIPKALTLLAATVLAGCAYAPYHSDSAVRDYDYSYSERGFNDRYYDDFYYYPSVGIYFNIHSGYYYYQHEHRWVRTLTLPRHYHLHPNHRVRMKAHRDQPYRDYQKHSKNYRGDGDRWRQHDGRNDGRGDRDGDRRRYDHKDRSERQERHSSVNTQHGPRRFERTLQDDWPERTERSGDDRRRSENVQRRKEASTTEKRRTLYQEAQRRQELRRGQENRQPDGRVKLHSGRTDNTDAQRHDARQQERQERRTSRSERQEAIQAESRVDKKAERQLERKAERVAERRNERRQAAQNEAQPANDRARRTEGRAEGRADRLEAGPVRRRSNGEASSDEDLRWLRHKGRDN